MSGNDNLPLISIIIPVKNAAKYLDESIPSILNQSYTGPIEVSIYDDGSDDDSVQIINKYIPILQEKGIKAVFRTRSQVLSESHTYKVTTGAAFARNRAIEQSNGEYICLLDSDDILTTVDQYTSYSFSYYFLIPSDSTEKVGKRLELQLKAALEHPDYLIGCNFLRIPEDGTPRYTQWCNRLTQEELYLHQYRECTIVQPTWFFSRKVYERVGGYDESEVGLPEDLIFFHKHLDLGGGLYKVQEPLIVYRYHPTSTSYKIHRLKLLEVRIKAFENRVLSKWDSFTIWGAGRDGCKFFGSLSMENKKKLVAFCDVDVNKVGTIYHQPYTNLRVEAKPPLVLCVAIDRTNGVFEQNVASLGLREGVDYWHFH